MQGGQYWGRAEHQVTPILSTTSLTIIIIIIIIIITNITILADCPAGKIILPSAVQCLLPTSDSL